MNKVLLAASAIVTLSVSVWAQDKPIAPTALNWMTNPALPKGGQVAILTGDPTKDGDTVVQRVLFPANYTIPPHTHPYSETVTVISGELGFGMGEKLDKSGPMLGAGTFLNNPAKHVHFVWTGGQPAIVQVQFVAPGGIDYIDPKDDPRKQ